MRKRSGRCAASVRIREVRPEAPARSSTQEDSKHRTSNGQPRDSGFSRPGETAGAHGQRAEAQVSGEPGAKASGKEGIEAERAQGDGCGRAPGWRAGLRRQLRPVHAQPKLPRAPPLGGLGRNRQDAVSRTQLPVLHRDLHDPHRVGRLDRSQDAPVEGERDFRRGATTGPEREQPDPQPRQVDELAGIVEMQA